MAKSVFEIALGHVLASEGGLSDHPDDPGGRTQKGVTQKTFDAWRKQIGRETEDVADISDEEVRQIYETNYWRAIRGEALPASIAIVMLDAAVNSGPANAAKALQKALKAVGQKVDVDGKLGPQTLKATQIADEERLLDEFVVQRGKFYGLLQTFRTFGLGWARRLVAGARLAHKVLDSGRAVDAQGESQAELRSDDRPEAQTQAAKISIPTEVRRYFYDGAKQQTYGSFFRIWGGWATARHVLTAMENRPPPFAKGSVLLGPDNLDYALIGCSVPEHPPAGPEPGQDLVAIGYPAGAHMPAIRRCRIYQKRPGGQVWICHILSPGEPVVVGMSGGLVFDEATRQILGIIVHRNSPADLDGDGDADQSLDFVAMNDICEQVNSNQKTRSTV